MKYKKRSPKHDYDLQLICKLLEEGSSIVEIEKLLGYGRNSLRYYLNNCCVVRCKYQIELKSKYPKVKKKLKEAFLNRKLF